MGGSGLEEGDGLLAVEINEDKLFFLFGLHYIITNPKS